MTRTVALIIGMGYSGSSLLNLLLDAQPGIRGLGEALHLLAGNDKTHCGLCCKPVRQCPLYAVVEPGRFYGSLFDYYGDCDVLVDSSKSVDGSLDSHPFEGDLDHRILLLSKAPHEFAWSYLHHDARQTAESAFRAYLDFYAEQIHRLCGQCWFRPWHCLRLTYRQLAVHTQATLRRLLDFLRRDGELFETSWQTDSHIIGGNWMVAAQLQPRREPFNENSAYLGGKYRGKYHTIFYDDQWRSDKHFVKICRQLYHCHRWEIQQVLADLGQPDFRQQIDDLGREFSLLIRRGIRRRDS